MQRHLVVVAQQHPGALRGQHHHLVEHGHRIAAVAHQVAQKGELIDPLLAGVVQTGLQGLPVGVDV